MAHVHRTQIDGVRTLWAVVPGLLLAHLSFRVGQTDESLPTRGITHLCEHLALSRFGVQQYSYNGSTGTTVTTFSVQGRPDEVVAHLGALCAGLSSGTFTERLDHERRVLDIEGANRSATVVTDHLGMRYGARGHGLIGWPEFGLHSIGRDDVIAWASRHFNRANAVLWLSGTPPEGLALPLGDGDRNTDEPLLPLTPLLPAWFSVDGPAAVTALVERSVASAAATAIAGMRTVEWLRHQKSAAYSPWTDYVRLDGDRAIIALGADGPRSTSGEAAWTLLSALTTLASDGPTARELTTHKEQVGRYGEDVHAPLGVLSRETDEILHSRPVTGQEQLDEDVAALDVGSVRAAAAKMAADALVQVPQGATVPSWTLLEYSAPDAPLTFGLTGPPRREYVESVRASSADELVYDAHAFALVGGHRSGAIAMDDETVMLAFGDGARRLIDRTGRQILIRPTAWPNGRELVAWLDERLARDRVVAAGVRDLGPAGSDAAALRTVLAHGRALTNGPAPIGPICLDEWTWEADVPPGAPDSTRRLPGAFLVGWLAHRNQLAAWVEACLPDTLAAFRAGRVSPVKLFATCGNWCTTDLATPPAAAFMADLAVAEPGAPYSRYEAGLRQVAGTDAPLDRLTERDATPIWTMLDSEWTARPLRGPSWLGEALSPPGSPLSIPPSRCQPIEG